MCSPDTLTGRFRAVDRDGLDSLWLTVDGTTRREDGRLEQVVEAAFRAPVAPGRASGEALPVAFRARNVAGLSHTVGDTAWVISCPAGP